MRHHRSEPALTAFLRTLAVLIVTLVGGGTARGDGSAPASFLDPLMARLAAISERRATFEEERTMAALSRPLSSHGLLVWRRPAHLEKTTLAPRAENLVVDEDTLTLASATQPPRALSLASQPQLAALVDAIRLPLAGDLAGLRRLFNVASAGTMENWTLTLTPMDPAVASLVRSVSIDGAGTAIRSVVTTQSNGDTQRLAITDQLVR